MTESNLEKVWDYKDIALLLVGFLILGIMIRYIGIGDIVQNIKTVSPFYFWLFVVIIMGHLLLWNYNWKLLVDRVKPIKYMKLLPVFAAGTLGNNITPGPSVGGEPIKAYFLQKTHGESMSSWFATAVMNGVLFFIIRSIILVVAVFYITNELNIPSLSLFIGWGMVALIILLLGGWYIYENADELKLHKLLERGLKKIYKIKLLRKKYPQFIDFKEKVREECILFKDVIVKIFTLKEKLLLPFLISACVIMAEFLGLYVLFLGLGVNISLFEIIVAFSIGQMVGYFVFLPGGIGVVEAVLLMIFTAMGVPMAVAATAVLLRRAIFYIMTYGFGYAALVYLNKKVKKNK